MSAEYAFDLYPRDDPRDGTRLVRYTYEDLIAAEYRDVIGVGSGQATMWADHAGAELVDVRGEQYARVVRLGGVEAVVGGIWTSKLPFETAVASERRHLTISGPGQMAYLARARMAPHTYIHDLFFGQDPFDGMWRLFAQGLGNTLGAILYRVIYEAQHFRNTATYTHEHGDGLLYTDSHADDRLASKIADLVMGFDNLEDSNGNAWTLTSGDFTAQVGENVLGVVQRLMQSGLSLWMDPDDFTLYAWEGRPATKLGRSTDRTGVAWGADIVRFQYPTDGTLATGNVLSETTRIVNAYLPQGPIWVGGNDIYHLETGPADALYEGFVPSGVEDLTALANIGAAQSTAREEAADVGQVKFRLGDDEATGAYLPGEHFRLDELVRVNTGTGEFDYDEDNYPVGAWRISLPEGSAEWEAYADLGASYEEAQRREFAVPSTAGHTHPPNPPLCAATTFGDEASCLTELGGLDLIATPNGDFEMGDGTNWSGAIVIAGDPQGVGGSWYSSASVIGSGGWAYAWSEDAIIGRAEVIRVYVGTSAPGFIRFGSMATTGIPPPAGDYTEIALSGGPSSEVCVAWTPTTAADNVKFHIHQAGSGILGTDNLRRYTGGGGSNPLHGTSPFASRCDHAHHELLPRDPTVNDDGDAGYPTTTLWTNSTSEESFLSYDDADGAADWRPFGGTSGPDLTAINFLVGTASGDLSAEIVVGATPGGELGGTWAAPTVDATHSGSAHHIESHQARHANGGADEVAVEGLGTAETDTALVLSPNGTGGVEFRTEAGGGGIAGELVTDTIIGDGVEDTFTLSETPTGTWALVSTNGADLLPSEYAIVADDIVFDDPPETDAEVLVTFITGGFVGGAAVDPGDIADPTMATAQEVAEKLNELMANMRTAGILV